MSILVLWATPNDNGLTAACKEAALSGIKSAGKTAEEVKLNALDIRRCQVCSTGFGICNTKHICCMDDDFNKLKDKFTEADAVILVSPVYWGEMSEPLKAFMDRLRRCEAKSGVLKEKKCIVVAAAGGSGNGAVNCLEQMDRYLKNVGMEVKDRLPIIRFSRDYMLTAIEMSAKKLSEEI